MAASVLLILLATQIVGSLTAMSLCLYPQLPHDAAGVRAQAVRGDGVTPGLCLGCVLTSITLSSVSIVYLLWN